MEYLRSRVQAINVKHMATPTGNSAVSSTQQGHSGISADGQEAGLLSSAGFNVHIKEVVSAVGGQRGEAVAQPRTEVKGKSEVDQLSYAREDEIWAVEEGRQEMDGFVVDIKEVFNPPIGRAEAPVIKGQDAAVNAPLSSDKGKPKAPVQAEAKGSAAEAAVVAAAKEGEGAARGRKGGQEKVRQEEARGQAAITAPLARLGQPGAGGQQVGQSGAGTGSEKEGNEGPQGQEANAPLRAWPLPPSPVWDDKAARYFTPLHAKDPMQQYIDHFGGVASRQGEGEEEKRVQYVAFVPDEGFGNRLRGAYSTFLLAMLLRRPFLLLWTKPCPVSLQLNNTLPWEWDLTKYPSLHQAYVDASPRVLYACLTQFLPGCEDRERHRRDLETADLAQLYADTDVLIIQDPDEYVSLLRANPHHREEVARIVDWAGDAYNRTYVERFVGRFLEPSGPVLAMMDRYRGRYTMGVHVRSEFCRGGDFSSLTTLLARGAPYPPHSVVYLALDREKHRDTVVSALRGLEGVEDVLYIDLPPVHSNDRLPAHASSDSYVSLMADFFLLSEAPGPRFLTDQSSFSEAVQFVSRARGTGQQDRWFCGRARDGHKAQE